MSLLVLSLALNQSFPCSHLPDHKIYLNSESIPYGINTVKALSVPDDDVSNRKVCILDTGYDINHPDLTSDPNIVTGYSGPNSAGPSPWTFDGHGHGTHVAGTIAAIGSNDEGVVGVNRNGQLKLHIVKVFGDNGSWGWQSSLIAAVEECVTAEANVISMSLGGGGFSQTSSDTYDRILNVDNILVVAAAGNDGDTSYSYPASYNSVMSVAATDSSDNVAGFSQKNNQVDIAAPGVGVRSTLPNGRYASWNGTSMACPHVSGVAALIWSHDTSKSAVEIRNALESSAIDLGATGRDDAYGHGLVRADLAMEFLDNGFTREPTQSPAPCFDNPEGWFDSDGEQYNCEWYAIGSRCAAYGDSYANNGKTANMACCACGGGTTDGPATSNPTKSPSFRPTQSPSKAPFSSPTKASSKAPTESISEPPSSRPTQRSTSNPSQAPTESISEPPSAGPTQRPTASPSRKPTVSPSRKPTASPSQSISLSPTPEDKEGVSACGLTRFVGSRNCPSHEELIDYTTLRQVRSCSDTNLGQPRKKRNQCSVWGATEKINDGCSGNLNFSAATAYCADAGGGPCTSEELVDDCT